MNFKKKLTIRMYTAVACLIIGVVLMVLPFALKLDNEYMSTFGFTLIAIGIARLRQHFRITRTEETIRQQEIRETDERNLEIARKAKSITFSCCLLLTCVAVIVLECLKIEPYSTILGASMCVQLLVYWITYLILQKRS